MDDGQARGTGHDERTGGCVHRTAEPIGEGWALLAAGLIVPSI
jgi:hypothetical protein